VARTERAIRVDVVQVAAVKRRRALAEGVDILEDVDLSGPGQSPGPSIQKAGQ
jgi:hypothetical protein